MKRFAFVLFFFSVFANCIFADQGNAIFEQANDAYQAKDYSKAIQMYEQLLTEGYQSPELEYNLGNAYFREGQLGHAILHYERGAILAPSDDDIQHNLRFANEQLTDDFSLLPQFFFAKLWDGLRMKMSATAWGVLALAIWWAGMIGLGIWLFGKDRSQKKKGFFWGLVALGISILPLMLALSRANFDENTKHAIVLSEQAAVRSAPDANGNEIITIHEGLKVKLLDEISGWWQVELPDGEKGWLSDEDMERI